ncbi:DUF4157 domain-containing protein [Chryseobacterium gambrini]|uniref:eCIS core domain-containing protein n=1 Tax=Chryseobacterium gambrini TaxID=373672 RepID=A0A1N7L9W7_9FLAO|nr:DUF4157 domain-containing protein [Chryseobacterium gambrini]SIS70628.1 protein of unknown function [Chryseobacterium gambrini]
MKTNQLQERPSLLKSNISFFKPHIQKKLSVGSANDSYEVEADRVADKVMKMSEPSPKVTHTGALLQKKCATCEQEEKLRMKPLAESISPFIQRSSSENGGVTPDHVENQINSSKGGGNMMDHETKNFMESRFGTDFSNVKIHTGSEAVQMSRDLNAQAFTVGSDIYFNEGKYNPNSDSGKHLLAHELTHTVQQSGGIGRKVQKLSDPDCDTTNILPLAGGCRDCFHNTCYSETFIPALSSALNISVSVDYCEDPGNIGPEDFSIQVFKCMSYRRDRYIGDKRLAEENIPSTRSFSIASVTPGDKYYIKIYSRSNWGLSATYNISQ